MMKEIKEQKQVVRIDLSRAYKSNLQWFSDLFFKTVAISREHYIWPKINCMT